MTINDGLLCCCTGINLKQDTTMGLLRDQDILNIGILDDNPLYNDRTIAIKTINVLISCYTAPYNYVVYTN